jgi:hypothetical protein
LETTASAVSLNVAEPTASAAFVRKHLGFEEEMADEGFVSRTREDAGFNLIFLRTGLATFKPEAMRGRSADGLWSFSWSRASTPSTRGCATRVPRSPPRSRPSRGASGSSR